MLILHVKLLSVAKRAAGIDMLSFVILLNTPLH